MNLVDRLKSSHTLLGDPLHREAWEEIERLRQQNAELVEALQCFLKYPNVQKYVGNKLYENAAAAIAKATGGE